MRSSAVPASAGHLFDLIRRGVATTRPELVTRTGLSRTAVSQRVDALVELGLIDDTAVRESSGGRPATRLRFRANDGVVLAADLDADRCRLGVSTLDGDLIAEFAADKPIALGPHVIMEWAVERFLGLLDELGRNITDVHGIGVGLPGPVEFVAGRAVSPPIMPGWDGVSIPELLTPTFPVPVLVDNDVNIMAVGEYATQWRDLSDDLLFVKVGHGIGCGIIVDGRIHRGAQGAAGDIGHIASSGHNTVVCQCGNVGCVEAVASGNAVAAALRDLGFDCPDPRTAARLVHGGNADAARLVREAGREIGGVLAHLVNSFNPSVIVVGGDVAAANLQLLAGIREVVYKRSTALATRHLELVVSRLGDRAGLVGGVITVLDDILSPESIDLALELRGVDGTSKLPGTKRPGEQRR